MQPSRSRSRSREDEVAAGTSSGRRNVSGDVQREMAVTREQRIERTRSMRSQQTCADGASMNTIGECNSSSGSRRGGRSWIDVLPYHVPTFYHGEAQQPRCNVERIATTANSDFPREPTTPHNYIRRTRRSLRDPATADNTSEQTRGQSLRSVLRTRVRQHQVSHVEPVADGGSSTSALRPVGTNRSPMRSTSSSTSLASSTEPQRTPPPADREGTRNPATRRSGRRRSGRSELSRTEIQLLNSLFNPGPIMKPPAE